MLEWLDEEHVLDFDIVCVSMDSFAEIRAKKEVNCLHAVVLGPHPHRENLFVSTQKQFLFIVWAAAA